MPESILQEQLIVGRERFGQLTEPELAGATHFAFGVDRNFVRGMGVAIVSILANNPERRFVFHICASSINNDDVPKLKQIVQRWATVIHIYQVDDGLLANFPTFEHLPVAIYYRIVLAHILAEQVRQLVYLDADIVCLGNVDEILSQDFGNHVVCVVAEDHAARVEWLQLQHERYFNSGMIFIDLGKWGKNGYSQQVLQCLEHNRERFTLPDQDALNVVLDGKVKFLDSRWNYFYDMGHQQEEIPADTVFLHYFGAIKPWEVICHHPMQKHYQKYERMSPWVDSPPLAPITASKMERYARELWQQGEKKKACSWYGRYLVEKFL